MAKVLSVIPMQKGIRLEIHTSEGLKVGCNVPIDKVDSLIEGIIAAKVVSNEYQRNQDSDSVRAGEYRMDEVSQEDNNGQQTDQPKST